MFIFPSKKQSKFGIATILNYVVWTFLVLVLIFFSWLFLFIYRHIYAVVVEETAIVNLKSQLVITKVHKTQFLETLKRLEEKQSPVILLDFSKIKNPFKTPKVNTGL
ncbi:MAG: hypothetical protein COU51_02410 [Parcubacteria group bacterium CG10_big_fil_rev_8_21_14_0_10_36_14]|nr:MAG: hypothetical protein COU51_02410 [Parcubacteria group bacterium CG10_big_fil_rev_8_21_14_0_10_36_14]